MPQLAKRMGLNPGKLVSSVANPISLDFCSARNQTNPNPDSSS
jgi:hypothetical protein